MTQDFIKHYRVESVLTPTVYEFPKTMHHLPKLGECVFRHGVIFSALKQQQDSPPHSRIVSSRDQDYG